MSGNDLVFDDLEISGFLSYPPHQPQKINLNTNRLTAIIGTVLDGGPGERNGAGKSAIIDAIQYLWFGRATRMPNQGFVNYVQTGPMLVSGTANRAGLAFFAQRGENPSVLRLFEKPVDDPRDWFTKGENGRHLFETTKSTKPETTKRIVELLGFDLKLTEVLLVNNPSDKSCYFLKDTEEQRAIQERIFGFTIFTEKAERLRELRKEENRNLATKESAFIATRQANDRVLNEINQLEEKAQNWAAERDGTVKFLTQQINSFAEIDFTAEQTVLTEINDIETDVNMIKREVGLYEKTVNEAETRCKQWDRKHQEDVTILHQTLAMLTQANANKDIETIKTRDRLRQEIAQIEAQITGYQKNIANLRKMLSGTSNQCMVIHNNITEIEEQILKLDTSTCPTCGQHWADTAKHLTHCAEERERLHTEYDKLNAQIDEQEHDLTLVENDHKLAELTLQTLTRQFAELPKPKFHTIEEASSAFARSEELTRKLTETKAATNPHTETLQTQTQYLAALQPQLRQRQEALARCRTLSTFLTLAELQAGRHTYATIQAQFAELLRSENPYRETIDNLRTNALKEVDETELRAPKTRIDHITRLITLLIDKDSPIRRAVLNEWLPELNMRANRYLELLELPHRMAFDAEMTATFIHRGKTLMFANLSAGQRLRAWLATNLAFREIFELINYRINLFFVDEVLDKGMSQRGAEVSYSLLNEMVKEDKSVFLITHRSELTDIADTVLSVTMEDGLSKLAA